MFRPLISCAPARSTQKLYPSPALASITDDVSFSSALSTGELDTCLLLVRDTAGAHPNTAELNCRLAEALFHCGRRDDALECGRRALSLGEAAGVLDFCAWLFSNSGRHDEAAAAYRRLIRLRPDWIEGYRHASGSLAAIGALDEAISYATAASD